MNSYIWIHIWIHINYEFIWFVHIWIHVFHEFIYKFGCTKVPDEYRWSPVRLEQVGLGTLQVVPLWCGLRCCSWIVVVIKLLRTSAFKSFNWIGDLLAFEDIIHFLPSVSKLEESIGLKIEWNDHNDCTMNVEIHLFWSLMLCRKWSRFIIENKYQQQAWKTCPKMILSVCNTWMTTRSLISWMHARSSWIPLAQWSYGHLQISTKGWLVYIYRAFLTPQLQIC